MPYRRSNFRDHKPLSQMNMTPLIDVLLVLIIMLILTVPILTHSLSVPLPSSTVKFALREQNIVQIDANDRLLWNGQSLSRAQLYAQLTAAARSTNQPALRFEPDPLASYDQSAKTIALIKDAGIETFGFVGNHKYRRFAR